MKNISDSEIEISVIIPTFNKYPQNLLTLYSIEHQHFDLSKIEVIMIDDGSNDQTHTLADQSFPFCFKLLRNHKNIGRPASRNIGIKAARGKVVIFLDAEIIVPPDFLKIHHHYHQKHSNLVLTGIMLIKKLYSVLYPNFSAEQLKEFNILVKSQPEFKARIDQFEKSSKLIRLLDKQHIIEGSFTSLSLVSAYERFYQRTIIANYGYGLEGYRIPWQLFGTGHVSVSKASLDKAGHFAEYPGYGWDDLEMGYRLYKNGALFLSDPKLVSYHQEHPVSNMIRDESKQNYYKFQETYREVDNMIISLTFLPRPFNLHEVNQLLINYQNLCKHHPESFNETKQAFREMLRQIGLFASENRPMMNLNRTTRIPSAKAVLMKEMEDLRKLGEYRPFLNCFERLLHL